MTITTANYPTTVAAWATFAFSIAMAALVFLDLKAFDLTYQAWDLWRLGESPVWAFMVGHPHAMRYVLYYPVFVLSEWTGLSVDLVFAGFCIVAIIALCLALASIERKLSEQPSKRATSYVVIFFLLALLMNGRLIFAFAGYALLIWSFVSRVDNGRWSTVMAIGVAAGLLLSSVSSGVLSVAALFCIGCLAWISWKDLRASASFKSLVPMLITVGLILAAFSSTVVIGLFKNIDYYGGGWAGVVGMLDHGFGRIFLRLGAAGVVAAAAVAIVGLAIGLVILSRLPNKLAMVAIALIPAALGGMVGISTMAVGLVPAILLLRWNVFSIIVPPWRTARTRQQA